MSSTAHSLIRLNFSEKTFLSLSFILLLLGDPFDVIGQRNLKKKSSRSCHNYSVENKNRQMMQHFFCTTYCIADFEYMMLYFYSSGGYHFMTKNSWCTGGLDTQIWSKVASIMEYLDKNPLHTWCFWATNVSLSMILLCKLTLNLITKLLLVLSPR